MLGAIIGDIIGSIYEFNNIKTTEFPLFSEGSGPTDDSVMSIAVAEWLLTDYSRALGTLEKSLVKWGKKYPNESYGPRFSGWLYNRYEDLDDVRLTRLPYFSYGNGSAMRCSACGWVASSLYEAVHLATLSAIVSHNHPEGIKGAQATAVAIYLAKENYAKHEIKSHIENMFGYDLDRDCDEIRCTYDMARHASCQDTMPAAFSAFFDSYDYESAVRLAVSLGGDSDTIACITGGIAEAFYGEIPEAIITEARKRIPDEFWPIINEIKGVV